MDGGAVIRKPRWLEGIPELDPGLEGIRTLIERNLPPREGFLFAMFPDQEPEGKGPPLMTFFLSFLGFEDPT